ncbi:MAG: winged helix-turn-helix domain-containing protein, partial [Chloroflexi bacterium]
APGDIASPGPTAARALLTPFDPLVWDRDRVERLFDFFYRIEIYVPEKNRRYGYYVYPFVLGEDLVARVDLKAERDKSVLRVKGAFIEDGPDHDYVAANLADELRLMADWLGLKRVGTGRRGDLMPALRAALKGQRTA